MSKSRSEKDEVIELPLTESGTGGKNEQPIAKSNRAPTDNLIEWYKSLPLVWKIVIGVVLFVIVAAIVGVLIYFAILRERSMEYYVFTVKTGDVEYAGTFANVDAMLFGDEDATYDLRLNESTNLLRANNFNRNGLDKFVFHVKRVGKLERLLIRHDNWGINPSWFLDWVEVNATKSGQVVRFTANRWLDRDQGDRRTTIEINAPSPT